MSKTELFRPAIFADDDRVVAAHSLRVPDRPGAFSMSARGTTEEIARENRALLARQLGLTADHIAMVRQVHGDVVYELAEDYRYEPRPEADAIITDKPGWLIGVLVADCIAVLLHDPTHQAVGVAHSGWRGSAANIAGKTAAAMTQRYDTKPSDLIAYLSPSPLRFEYGLPNDDADQFGPHYSSPKSPNDKWFDNKLVVYDQLLAAGLNPEQIEADPRSNLAEQFHSFRRDRDRSGRHLVGIAIRLKV